MKLIGQRLDKKHKEYKEGKKVIKGIIKRQQFRGNVIPWCQFASFELETSSLPEVIQEIYLQALQLAWSLKQKSNLQKGKFRNKFNPRKLSSSSKLALKHLRISVVCESVNNVLSDLLRNYYVINFGCTLIF